MDDALLFIHGLMKLALVIGIMVLVATAPSHAYATGHGQQAVAAHANEYDQDEEPSWGRRMLHDDDRWLDADDASPCMNIDGTPMAGDLDIHGNFYGDCSASSMWDD
ncbi:MAG: hypothetical protein HEQ37_19200 [Acidovorax sp.]|nr:hypothetical protein [Acidovorax sp.]